MAHAVKNLLLPQIHLVTSTYIREYKTEEGALVAPLLHELWARHWCKYLWGVWRSHLWWFYYDDLFATCSLFAAIFITIHNNITTKRLVLVCCVLYFLTNRIETDSTILITFNPPRCFDPIDCCVFPFPPHYFSFVTWPHVMNRHSLVDCQVLGVYCLHSDQYHI